MRCFELCGGRIGVLARGEHALREARFLLNYTQGRGGRIGRVPGRRRLLDQKQETTVPGLYAAGDVVQSLSQISVAFGQAAIAASAINVSLNEERWPD